MKRTNSPLLLLTIFAIAILFFTSSCNNAPGNASNGSQANPPAATQDTRNFSGSYRLVEDSSAVITIKLALDAGVYTYIVSVDSKDYTGTVTIDKQDTDTYAVFDGIIEGNPAGAISGQLVDNSIIIQNYGNADNEYLYFKSCDSKYLHFVKSATK